MESLELELELKRKRRSDGGGDDDEIAAKRESRRAEETFIALPPFGTLFCWFLDALQVTSLLKEKDARRLIKYGRNALVISGLERCAACLAREE
ncbi:hypothetical protein AKJ16_DCAP16775 [Drosera capensis]